MKRRDFIILGTGAAIGGALSACGGGGGGGGGHPPPPATPPLVRNRVAAGWNQVAQEAVLAVRPSPPVAARMFALLHTAMYDAWSAYDAVALSTRHQAALRRPLAERTLDNQRKAFSFAAYAALLKLIPAQQALFDARMRALGYNPAEASLDFATPQGIGTIAARILLDYAAGDGANSDGSMTPGGLPYADYSGYVPQNQPLIVAQPTPRSAIAAPGRWQPLSYRNTAGAEAAQVYVLPYWGQVRPFALRSGAQYRPGAPAQFGTPAFADQVRDMVAIQAALTEEHKAMADFWAGGRSGQLPVATWSQFADWVSLRDQHDEAKDIKLYFALANALFDAGIAAWDAKRAYDSVRPITAVRYLLAGHTITGYGFGGPAEGLRQIAGESWVPYHLPSFPTPAFPDHVSGHSTYSAASAQVLKLFTGSDAFKHSVTIGPRTMLFDPALPSAAVTLKWDTFTYAACEAGTSRIYAGIHFHNADTAGRTLGELVGAAVFEKARCYWSGILPA